MSVRPELLGRAISATRADVKRIAALLLMGMTAGCGVVRWPAPPPQPLVIHRLDRADALARAGQYTDAREVYSTVLAGRGEPAGADRALIGLARLALVPENPGKDERQAAVYLDRLLVEYPQSGWASEARTWRDLLGSVERLQREVRRHQQHLERLRRELQHEQQETLRLRQERERLRQIDIEFERPIHISPTSAQTPLRAPRE
jgi:hypothetical protein